MFVKDMTNDSELETIHSPSWPKIESAIRSLDGIQSTLITLGGEGPTHLAIGGGTEGQYVVYMTPDNLNYYNLIVPSKPYQPVYLMAGGQLGQYPARQCVDLDTVLLAAKTFAQKGQLEELVCWERD
jgi:hypothetical protein